MQILSAMPVQSFTGLIKHYMFLGAALLLLCSTTYECEDLVAHRTAFFSIDSKAALLNFLKEHPNSQCNTSVAYQAALSMRQAEYSANPYKKWQFFKQGRNLLEQSVANEQQNVEIRFVRYIVQSKLPSFLNYNSEMQSDKNFIQQHLKQSDIPLAYQQKIKSLLQ